MTYYVSMADNDTGQWLHAAFVDAPTHDEAGAMAVRLLGPGEGCIEIAMCEVPPAQSRRIPRSFRGRLLTLRELESMGALRHLVSDGETLKEAPPSPRPS